MADPDEVDTESAIVSARCEDNMEPPSTGMPVVTPV